MKQLFSTYLISIYAYNGWQSKAVTDINISNNICISPYYKCIADAVISEKYY